MNVIAIPDRPSFAFIPALVADAQRIAELGEELFGPDTPPWFVVKVLLDAYDGSCLDCGAPTRPRPPLVLHQCVACQDDEQRWQRLAEHLAMRP